MVTEMEVKTIKDAYELPDNTIKVTIDLEKNEVVAFTVQEKEKGL